MKHPLAPAGKRQGRGGPAVQHGHGSPPRRPHHHGRLRQSLHNCSPGDLQPGIADNDRQLGHSSRGGPLPTRPPAIFLRNEKPETARFAATLTLPLGGGGKGEADAFRDFCATFRLTACP